MPLTPHRTFTTKKEARTWALLRRAELDSEAIRAMSIDIAGHLSQSAAFESADTVLTFIGAKTGELDTRPIVEMAWNAGKCVLVPIARSGGMLVWSRLDSMAELVRTSRGLLEPREDTLRPQIPEGGLCIVPGACFRWDGHRIGFGGGYYDRFLAGFRGESVALSPEACFGVLFPVEPHDQPVAAVVTESGYQVSTKPTGE